MDRRTLLFSLVATSASLAGCSGAPYVWASEVPKERAAPPAESLQIRPGDVVTLVVAGSPEWTGEQPVSSDGTIILTDVGPVRIAGKTPEDARQVISARLERILEAPEVSIAIAVRRVQVTVMGEVQGPGNYQVTAGDGIVSALTMAGGLTEFAHENAIYLVRPTEPRRIRFRLKDLTSGGNSARAFPVRDGDLIVVE